MLNSKGVCAYAAQLCSKIMTMKSGGNIAGHALVAPMLIRAEATSGMREITVTSPGNVEILGLEHCMQFPPEEQVIGNVPCQNDHGWTIPKHAGLCRLDRPAINGRQKDYFACCFRQYHGCQMLQSKVWPVINKIII